MSERTKIDYSKLLGFNIVADELKAGVGLKNPTVAARIGAKVGTIVKTERPMPLQPDVSGPGLPVMRGLGGRKV